MRICYDAEEDVTFAMAMKKNSAGRLGGELAA
jgi:hypothetical protein